MDKGGCYLPEGVEYHLEKHEKSSFNRYFENHLRYHLNVSSKRIFLFFVENLIHCTRASNSQRYSTKLVAKRCQ
jgi:hypothetical protein